MCKWQSNAKKETCNENNIERTTQKIELVFRSLTNTHMPEKKSS